MEEDMRQEERFTKESLEACMNTKTLGRRVHYKKETDSTNTEGKRLAEEMEAGGIDFHGILVVAEKQTGGKGRKGKSWNSPEGSGIWMSLLLKPEIRPEAAPMMTLVAAVSVAKAIKKHTGLEAVIKWPNDIIVNRKKVCGILTEMSSQPERIRYVVVGIGINVNIETFPEEIRETATSLWLEKGRRMDKPRENREDSRKPERISRIGLIGEVMAQMEADYDKFLQTANLHFLVEEYNQMLANCNRQVKVLGEKEIFQGAALGINEEGELLVKTEEGLMAVRSGEVSVRGLYGYV